LKAIFIGRKYAMGIQISANSYRLRAVANFPFINPHFQASVSRICYNLIIKRPLTTVRRQDGSVGIATSYGLDEPLFDYRQCKDFLFSTTSRPALRPSQTPIPWIQQALPRE
jgi:hypothetical protein